MPSALSPFCLVPSAADEVDDLDLVAFLDGRAVERVVFQHHEIVLHGNASRVDVQSREKLGYRQGTGDLVAVAVQGDLQVPAPILAHRQGFG